MYQNSRAIQTLKTKAMTSGLLNDDFVRNSLRALEISGYNQRLANVLEYRMEKALKNDVPDIVLGADIDTDEPRGIKIQDIVRHMLISGGSGFGKSLLQKLLLYEFSLRGINWTDIDPSVTGEYKDLFSVKDDIGEILFLNINDPYLINPLVGPKGVDKETYASNLAHVFAVNFSMKYSMGIMVEMLMDLYAKIQYPNITHLQRAVDEKIKKLKYGSKDALYLGTLKAVLRQIPPSYREAYTCARGYLPRMMDKKIVLCTSLTNNTIKLITELVFLYLSFQHTTQIHEKPYVLAVDECQHHVLARQPHGESVATHLLESSFRKCNIGLLASAQSPSVALSKAVVNNCATKISFGFGDSDETERMSKHLYIRDPGTLEMFHSLTIGQAIRGRFDKEPSVMQIPEFKLRTVSEYEIERYMWPIKKDLIEMIRDEEEPVEDIVRVPKKKQQVIEKQEKKEEVVQEQPRTEPEQEPEQKVKPDGYLDSQQELILRTYIEHPFTMIMELRNLLADAFKSSTNKIYSELLDGMMLDDDKENAQNAVFKKEALSGIGKRGAPPQFLVLTDKGRHYVEKYLQLKLPSDPRGTPQHTFMCHVIKRSFEKKKATAEIGKTILFKDGENLAKKEVDIVITMQPELKAVEVNLHNTKNLRADIEKLLKAKDQFDEIIVVNILKKNLKAVEKKLKPLMEKHPQIRIEKALDYLK